MSVKSYAGVELTDHECEVLRSCSGETSALCWGAWVSACLESLHEKDLIVSEGDGTLTDLGKTVLDVVKNG